MSSNIQSGATFSPCRKYRYVLFRVWDEQKPLIMFIGLNPSTANEENDDPTIRRVKQFAQSWGFGGVYMMNLFGLVTPYPVELTAAEDPVGLNDGYLEAVSANCTEVVFAWGKFPEATSRAEVVKVMFPNAKALLLNKDGSPRHPLYVKSDVVPTLYFNI